VHNEAIFFVGNLNVCHQCSFVTLSMQLGLHIGDFLDSTIDYTICFPRWFSCSYLLSANQAILLSCCQSSQKQLLMVMAIPLYILANLSCCKKSQKYLVMLMAIPVKNLRKIGLSPIFYWSQVNLINIWSI